jgi:hypothetical protein
MGIAPENIRPNPYDRFKAEAQRFFDSQLERLGLSEAQIKEQDISSLEDSLIRIDDALRNPESFGVLSLNMTADAAVMIVKSNTEAHIQIGVVPILLERKRMVIERLRLLRSQRPIKSLLELIDSLSDSDLRERLRTEFDVSRQAAVSIGIQKDIHIGYAFIAMAMDPNDPSLEDVLDAIKDGASKCDITAERIDEASSNEPITVRMLTAIETAEFVVVDLTNARPNVYYEAGYAQGLGKTPIYLARKGTDIPFDVKDYPVIFYPNMRDLKTSLAERLAAVRAGRK